MSWGHPERGKVLLLAGDFVLAAAGMIFASIIPGGMPETLLKRTGLIAAFVLLYSICFYIFDLYDVQALSAPRTITRIIAAAVSGTCIFSFFFYLFQWPGFGRGAMVISVAFLVLSSFGWRTFYKKHRGELFRRRTVLMVGNTDDALNLYSVLEYKHSQYDFCGFLRLDASASAVGSGVVETPAPLIAVTTTGTAYLSRGTVTLEEPESLSRGPDQGERIAMNCGVRDFGLVNPMRLEELASCYQVDTVVIRQSSDVTELAETLTRLRFQGIRISTMADLCSQILEELPLDTLSDMWFTFATGFNLLHVRVFRRIKRLTDILMACVGLFVTIPICILVAVVIKLESPGPVLFRQWRVGWKEKPFTLLKFRSMRQDAESDGKAQWASADDSRATRVGRILRRLHIDELPQMINVLLGEMSFVGPRPERPIFAEQLKELVPFYSLRHHLPPGITGWAQVNYPYGASVEDARRKLQYDLFYVRNASPTMDLRILLRTARVILFRRGSR